MTSDINDYRFAVCLPFRGLPWRYGVETKVTTDGGITTEWREIPLPGAPFLTLEDAQAAMNTALADPRAALTAHYPDPTIKREAT